MSFKLLKPETILADIVVAVLKALVLMLARKRIQQTSCTISHKTK